MIENPNVICNECGFCKQNKILEQQLAIAVEALKDIHRKLLTIDISYLSSLDRDKLYDIMFNDGIIDKVLQQIKELNK